MDLCWLSSCVSFTGLWHSDIWKNMSDVSVKVFFWLRWTFKSVNWVKQISFHNMGRPHPISWRGRATSPWGGGDSASHLLEDLSCNIKNGWFSPTGPSWPLELLDEYKDKWRDKVRRNYIYQLLPWDLFQKGEMLVLISCVISFMCIFIFVNQFSLIYNLTILQLNLGRKIQWLLKHYVLTSGKRASRFNLYEVKWCFVRQGCNFVAVVIFCMVTLYMDIDIEWIWILSTQTGEVYSMD